MSNLQTYYHFKLDFQKVDQVVNPRHQTPQGQSVATYFRWQKQFPKPPRYFGMQWL